MIAAPKFEKKGSGQAGSRYSKTRLFESDRQAAMRLRLKKWVDKPELV